MSESQKKSFVKLDVNKTSKNISNKRFETVLDTSSYKIPENEEEFCVFPTKIKFEPCFIGTKLTKYLIISNTGAKPANFRVSIRGNSFFSTKITNFLLDSGGNTKISVFYHPLSEGDHEAIVDIKSDKTEQITVIGSCKSSIIDIPDIKDKIWMFEKFDQTPHCIPITNRSFTKSLRVSVYSNNESFKVKQSSLLIDPTTTCDACITYDSSVELKGNPKFILKCDDESIRLERNLFICSKKASVIIDFGETSVNTKLSKELTVSKETKFENEPKSPFSFSVSEKTFYFTFHPRKVGEFQEKLVSRNFNVILKGKTATIPFIFDTNTNRFINTTQESIKVVLSPLSKDLQLENNIIEIEPNESVELQISNTSKSINESIIEASCGNTKTTICLPEKENSEETTITELSSSSSLSVSGRRSIIKTPEKQTFSMSNGFNESMISISPSFAFFANVDGNKEVEVPISVKCDDYFELKGPEWIRFPQGIESEKIFTLKCLNIPEEVCYSHIIVESEDNQSIPIIAYRGKSDLTFSNTVRMEYKGRNQFSGELEITNNGSCASFLLLTTSYEDTKVKVLPSDAYIIKPGETHTVTFVVFAELSSNISIPIIAYHGDEIIRQMRGYFMKEDALYTAFEPYEIGELENVLSEIDAETFINTIKQRIKTSQLVLRSSNKQGKSTNLLSSQSTVNIKEENSSVHFSLTNISSEDVGFDVEMSSSLAVLPFTGTIKKYSETEFTVTSNGSNETDTIRIVTTDGIVEIPVTLSTKKKSLKVERKNKAFTFKSSVDFGKCSLSKTKKAFLSITNLTSKELQLKVRRNTTKMQSSFLIQGSLTLKPLSISELALSFSPIKEKLYSETVVIQSDKFSSKLNIYGEGVQKSFI